MAEPHEQAVDEALWKFHQRNTRERFFGVVGLDCHGGTIERNQSHFRNGFDAALPPPL